MAFASVGSLGTASGKGVGSISVNPSSSVPVGDLVVVFAAVVYAGGPGDPDWFYGCTDSQGNLYAQLGHAQANPGGNGANGMVFVCKLNTAITGADTITVRNNYGSGTVKAMSVWQFTIGGKWAFRAIATDAANSGDPASQTIAGLVSQEYLWLHSVGSNGPNSDSFTASTNYTAATQAGTTGGAVTDNETVVGEFRIFTGTTDSVDVTNNTAARAYGQVYVALYEFTDTVGFPTTPILDNFNRANESPLAGGWNTAAMFTFTDALVSNAATSTGSGAGGQVWGTTTATFDQEAYATLTAKPGAAGRSVAVVAPARTGDAAPRSLWYLTPSISDHDWLTLGGAGSLGGINYVGVSINMTVGNKLGIRFLSGNASLFLDTGSGFQWWGGSYNGSVPAGGTAWSPGLMVDDTGQVARMDDFGGGPFVSPLGHLLPILGVGS
jgi:hypothetical protein